MDKATAQTHLDAWLAADLAISKGKSYSIGDRQLSRVDSREIRDNINYWKRVVDSYTTTAAGSNSPASLAKFS